MQLFNLTPHEITIVDAEGLRLLVLPSIGILRAAVESAPAGEQEFWVAEFGTRSVPLTSPPTYGGVTSQPLDYIDCGTASSSAGFIVSEIAAKAIAADPESLWHQFGVFSPADLVRDAQGQPIGCRSLTRWDVAGPDKMNRILELSTVDDTVVRNAVNAGSQSDAYELAERLEKIRQLAT